jgi:hypothetical protein
VLQTRHLTHRQRGLVAIAIYPRDQAGPSYPNRQSRIKREPYAVSVHAHLRYRRGMEPSLQADSPCVCHRNEVTTLERDCGESPILSPPGFRVGLLIRIQLISQVTGWWVCLHRAAYSPGVR